MKIRTLGLQAVALGALLLGAAGSASAGFVPVFVSEANTANSSIFTYTINFTSNGSTESLTSGDFFTLYDIGSFTSATAASFTISAQNTGLTAPFTAPPDSATISNLSGTYNGATLTADTAFTVSITLPGILGTTSGYYSSTDSIPSGKNSQTGRVTLPGSAIPEPGTYAALALGGVLGAVALRRRAAQA